MDDIYDFDFLYRPNIMKYFGLYCYSVIFYMMPSIIDVN